MTRQNLFTIAAHAPFLQTLVDKVCDGTLLGDWDISTPFGLSDITIILPTQRARLALAEAFANRLGGATLLPDIRTFGGAPEEEEPFLPPFDVQPLPPAISPLRRKLILSQLVESWIAARGAAAFTTPGLSGFSNPPSAAEILSLAGSLTELIDDCHVEGVVPAALKQIAPENLSENWQTTLQFLEVALDAWPEVLTDLGEIDAAEKRNIQLQRQSDATAQIFGDRPVIAAGSTGSVPATAKLLKAVASLPRGVLVLPGLDTSLSAEKYETLTDVAHAPHGHPQYGLTQLLSRFGTSPAYVDELAPVAPNARTKIVRHALALAEHTADWADVRKELDSQIPDALAGLSIAVTRTDEEQARTIALAARDALERQLSVGIISPDRNLARRIAAELARFDIAIDDSAGTPLFQSRTGRLARQVLAVAANRYAPVDVMALLRNQRVSLGMTRAELVAIADLMEISLLRGQRPAPGIDGLRTLLAANLAQKIAHVPHQLSAAEGTRIEGLLSRLQDALAPLIALLEKPNFGAAVLAQNLGEVMDKITTLAEGVTIEPVPEYRQFTDWLGALKGEVGRGPKLSAFGIDATLEGLMANVTTRAPGTSRPDIMIWGQLEARLQNPELLILAGLSEGVWPQVVDPGPWLSRGMRIAAGLEPPERRQGQAAHDFEMALGNAKVLITRAERIGTSPAVPSRLLQRLEAFIGPEATGELAAKGAIWVEHARNLDFAGTPKPATRPTPKPSADMRPKSLSITEVETLVRSPYDLYAKYVLGLHKLDPLGDDPSARERGTLIHEVFARFVQQDHDPAAADALDKLMEIAAEEFTALEALPERRILWLERFKPAAIGFLEFESGRAGRVVRRHAELSGKWVLPGTNEVFTLRGRADRIDEMVGDSLEIIDFKTGTIPTPTEMKEFTAPQLLLEAAMAREGAFEDVPANPASALTYIKIGAGPEAFNENAFIVGKGMDLTASVNEVVTRLSRHVGTYLLSADTPMSARIFPNPKQRHTGDYDHVARTSEWTLVDGEDEA